MSNKFSHSRVETFKQCPQKFKYRYLDKLETIFNCDPQNPLIVGTALHHGIETTIEQAIQEYYMSYPVINTLHTFEAMKLEHWIPRVKKLINTGNELTFEYELDTGVLHGFIDLLEKLPDGTYAIYDFKYSNNIDHYLESPQLSLYKHYFEKQTGFTVSRLGFIFVPKVMIRQKKTETEYQFMKRLRQELDKKEITVKEVQYEESHVEEFRKSIIEILSAEEYPKCESRLCDYCSYRDYCLYGNDIDIIKKE